MFTHIAPFALHRDFFQSTSTRLLSQVAAHYRDSTLAEGCTAHAWLHDLMSPDRLTLLTFDNQSPTDAVDAWASLLVIDTLSQPAPHELGGATYVLIRPDGYLACMATREEPMLEWLQRWFPR